MSRYLTGTKFLSSKWVKALLLVLAFIIPLTFLVFPASSMTSKYICGKTEHIHTEECYSCEIFEEHSYMICGTESGVVHHHDEFCYDSLGNLICGLNEKTAHIHGDECYDSDGVLICTIKDEPCHQHTAECFETVEKRTEKKLVCTIEEHTHNDSCLPEKATQETVTTESTEKAPDETASSSAPVRQKAGAANLLAASETWEVDHTQAVLASGSCGTNVTYTLYADGTLYISGTGAMTGNWADNHWQGKKYPPWYSNRASITGIYIDEGVTTVGPYAFKGYTAPKKVHFPQSLISIGTYAFDGDTALLTADLSDCTNLTTIGSYAFHNCTGIQSLDFPKSIESIDNYAFNSCSKVKSIDLSGCTNLRTIGSYCFMGETALTAVDLSGVNHCTFVEKCFSDTTGDKRAIIFTIDNVDDYVSNLFPNTNSAPLYQTSSPKKKLYINGEELSGELVLGEGVTAIPYYAFSGCTKITSISFPSTLTKIGWASFYGTAFETLDLSENTQLNSIEGNAFKGNTALTEVIFPEDSALSEIKEYTFDGCTSLKSVDLSNLTNLTTIGSSCFNGCTSLESVDLSGLENLTTIGASSFNGCTSLESVDFSNLTNLTTIDASSFNGCSSLSTFDSHGCTSLATIGSKAFNNCSKLKEFVLSTSDITVANDAFTGSGLNTLTIEATADELKPEFIAALTASGRKISTVNFAPDSYLKIDPSFSTLCTSIPEKDFAGLCYFDSPGAMYLLDEETHTATFACLYSHGEEQSSYTVLGEIASPVDGEPPYPVTKAAKDSLYYSKGVTSLIFEAPENFEYIPDGAFGNDGILASVNGVTTMDGALALFTREGAGISDYAFFNTALDNRSLLGAQQTEKLEIKGQHEEQFADLYTGVNIGSLNPEFYGEHIFYTGETPNIALNLDTSVVPTNNVLRLYFAFSDDKSSMTYVPREEPYQFKTNKDGVYLNMTVRESDVKDVYIYDIPMPAEGATANIALPCFYASPSSGGGTADIWMVRMTSQEAAANPTGLVFGDSHHHITWETKSDDFDTTKNRLTAGLQALNSAGITTTGFYGNGTADGNIALNNLTYTFTFSRTSETLSVGKDLITTVEFIDEIQLPENMWWLEGLAEAVENGNYRFVQAKKDGGGNATVSISSKDHYRYDILATVDGKEYRVFSLFCPKTISVNTGMLGLLTDDNGNILLHWGINNSSKTEEIAIPSLYIQLGDEVLIADEEVAGLGTTFRIVNYINGVYHFTYGEDKTSRHGIASNIASNEAGYTFTKTFVDSYYCHWNAADRAQGELRRFILTLQNSSSGHYRSFDRIYDELPDYIYLSKSDFNTLKNQAGTLRDITSITITISNATFCNTSGGDYSPGSTITATDGKSYVLTPEFAGVGTRYDGLETDDTSELATDGQIIVTITPDKKMSAAYSYGEVSGSADNITDIQQFLDSIGYIVTRNCKYRIDWNFDNRVVCSGENTEIQLYTHSKDTFMYLQQDKPTSETLENGDYFVAKQNTAKIHFNHDGESFNISSTEAATSSGNNWHRQIVREFTLSGGYRLNGVDYSSGMSVQSGDVISNSIRVYHLGSKNLTPNNYSYVPLVDKLSGPQAVMVPASDNSVLSTEYGLETETINGVEYYVLRDEGVYKGVTLSGVKTDSITVTRDGANISTMIRWYVTGIVKECTKNFSFDTLVDTELTEIDSLNFTVKNEAWLNDHESHRLYATVGSGSGSIFGFDKSIVTNFDSIGTPENDALTDYSLVHEGEEVIYRFAVSHFGTGGITFTGSNFKDMLPAVTEDGFRWETADVEVLGFSGDEGSFTVQNGDHYQVTDDSDDRTVQYIIWGDDFRFRVTGTAYVYVKVTMPSGDDWAMFAEDNSSKEIENRLYIHGLYDFVNHELALEGKAFLQKGVVGTGEISGDTYFFNTDENARWNYQSNGYYEGFVQYYAVVYNDGLGRLYIDELQDCIPDQFTFYKFVDSNLKPKLYDKDGNLITVIWKTAKFIHQTNNTVHLFQLQEADSGTTLNYDGRRHKYYLDPGEGFCIVYACKTGTIDDVQPSATNHIAMCYYDYTDMGIVESECTAVGPEKNSTLKNDGSCETYKYQELPLSDFMGLYDSDWLYSDVTLYQGKILPGITKHCLSTVNTTGGVTNNPASAFSTDTINWGIVVSNNGSTSISNYLLTDVMNDPYTFCGDVKYKFDLGGGESGVEIPLFTFGDEYESEGKTIQPLTYKYNSSLASKTEELIYETDSETGKVSTQEIIISPYYTYSGSKTRATGNIGVRIYINNAGRKCLELHFYSSQLSLTPKSAATLYVSTKNTGAFSNKVYFNSAYITPIDQEFNSGLVTQGNCTEFNGNKSVMNSAQILVTYGFATTSSKTVTEYDSEHSILSTATSGMDTDYIVLSDKTAEFSYDLTVNNSDSFAMKKLVIIDNMPEVGDHNTFSPTDMRFSEFDVELKDGTFRVYTESPDGETADITSHCLFDFSTETEFNSDDWNGMPGAKWYSAFNSETRSFRMTFADNGIGDNAADGDEPLIPKKYSIHIEFVARIKTDPDLIEHGQTAWNTFGYRYVLQNNASPLEASPLRVGVRAMDYPVITKVLEDSKGRESRVTEDSLYRFLVYTGSPISGIDGLTESEIASTLTESDRDCTYIECPVLANHSSSEPIVLNECKKFTYSTDWQETADDFIFENGDIYTVLELQADDNGLYSFGSICDVPYNNIKYVYNCGEATPVTAINIRNEWGITVRKTDDYNVLLADAWFGLYSLSESDKMTNSEYNHIDISPKPELTKTVDEKTYYLTKVSCSNEYGTIHWGGLTSDEYLISELVAPEGHFKDDEDKIIGMFDESGKILRNVNVTIVNISCYALPHTGGEGLSTIYLGGFLLIASAAIMLKKRKNRQTSL